MNIKAPAHEPKTQTVVDKVEKRITHRILRGEYTDRLPSVRALAAEFETTVPTIQRVTARLEAHGLVEARQGSGVRILDPDRHGTLSLLPFWFEALRDQPEQASRVFSECMELRRLVAGQLLRRVSTPTPALAEALRASYAAKTFDERRDADLAFSRAVLDAAGHFGARALFNTVEKVIREVPGIAEAFYEDVELHRQTLSAIVDELGRPNALVVMDQALAAWDAKAAERFEAYLRRAHEPGPATSAAG